MAVPDDAGLLEKAVTWIAAGAASLVGLVWGDMKHRVGKVEKALEFKAEKNELDRQRGHVEKIFDRLGRVELAAAEIRQQMLAYTSDIESEKRTRAEANRALNDKLDRLLERRDRTR